MQNIPDGQPLIGAFFAALELRHLNQCGDLLAQLETLSGTQPAYAPWCAYLAGILANERDRDWARAERIFNNLLQADLDRPLRARALLALGRAYDYQGRWLDAIRVYSDSLPIFEQLEQPLDRVKVWKQIAIAYRNGFAAGDFGAEALQLAIENCKRALDVLGPAANPPPDVAWLAGSVWNTLGLIHMNLGDWAQAIGCYQQDMAICRSLNDQHGIGISYLNLGEIHQKRGRESWPEALDCYRRALEIFREFDNRYLEADILANLGFLHQEIGAADTALDHYAQAIAIIEELRAGVSSEDARAGFFATVADIYANAALLCVQAGRLAQAFDYVERARARAFLDILAARSAELPERFEAATLSLAATQAALPEHALLLEYFSTGLIEVREGRAAPGVQRHRFPPAKTLVFALTRATAQVYDLGISPNDLRPSRLDSAVEQHFLQPAIRRALYDKLIAPAEALLRGQRRLYIAPHGPLHYIPFQALIAGDDGPLLRADGPELVYGPSATVLFRPRHSAERAPEPCLALGYNGAGANQLRFAEEEARSIARLAGGHALAGAASKKAALFAQAPRYRLLHLSCHGRFDSELPLNSALYLAPDEDLTAAEVIERLRLRCDLVALSACESGLNRVRRGDELVGLVRAFMYAGAPALLCTLWRVDERSTRLLMDRFYREAQAGAGFAEALKRAQLYLMRLTRREALEALVRLLAADLVGRPTPPMDGAPAEPLQALEVGGAYLKGQPAGDASHEATPGDPDELIFDDPYYWAPFVFIGDPGPR